MADKIKADELLAEYVTQPELAKAFDVTTRTIRVYENLPNGLPSVKVGRKKMYRLSSVKKWIEGREVYPNKQRK